MGESVFLDYYEDLAPRDGTEKKRGAEKRRAETIRADKKKNIQTCKFS